MDTIVIQFEGLQPQEVRVQPWAKFWVFQFCEWCDVCSAAGVFVAFKAKLERWERVRGVAPR